MRTIITLLCSLSIASEMSAFEGENKSTIELKDGSIVKGTVVARFEDSIVLETDFAGRITLDRGMIGRMTENDIPKTEIASPPATTARPHTEQENDSSPWSFRFEVGLNGNTGNTERTAFRSRAEANRDRGYDRLKFFAEGNYAEEEGVRSVNEIFGGAKYERDLNERWFYFLKGDLERDEFENLDLRATGTAGIGYFFIREQDHELKGHIGAGYQHESFDDGTRTGEPVLDAGYEYRLDVNDYLRFTHSLNYIPTLEDPAEDYRIQLETAGEIPLGKEDSIWKLKAGMRNEYDSIPQPGIERLDTIYFLNLVAQWK